MAEQNLKNHVRIDPVYYVIVFILLLNIIIAIVHFAHRADTGRAWNIVIAVALLFLASLVRTYALRVQDRVIRLEEQIRMAALLPLESRPLQRELTTGQIIALRFASDAELAELAERTVRENLPPKTIKQQIKNWRADTHRV